MRVRPAVAASAVAIAAATAAAGGGPLVSAAGPPTRGIPAPDAAVVRASAGWQPLARPPIPALAALGGAHPGATAVRVNQTRARLTRAGRQRFPYPVGTVIVKTARRDGFVSLVAIMRKVARNGADGGGWRFVEYKRDSGSAPFAPVQVGVSVCTGCHVQAAERQRSDWVFFRLR